MSVISHAPLVASSVPSAMPRASVRMLAYLATAVTALAQEITFIEHLEELRRRIPLGRCLCRRDLRRMLDVRWGFQIPAVVLVLSRIGLLTAGMLVRYFRHAVLGCAIVAAVITPTTDFANMLIIAGPMVALYWVGIGVAWMFGRKRVGEPLANLTGSRPMRHEP